MWDKFDSEALQTLGLAAKIAEECGRDSVGTEHILLGIIMKGPNGASQALISGGVSLRALCQRLRTEGSTLVHDSEKMPISEAIGFRPHTIKALSLAEKEADRLGHNEVGPEHILLAISREGDNVAAYVLETFGMKLDNLRKHVSALSGSSGSKLLSSQQIRPQESVLPDRPRAGRLVLLRSLRALISVIVFIALIVGLAQAITVFSEWTLDTAGAEDANRNFVWPVQWLIFITVVLVLSCIAHWPTLKRVFSKRSLKLLFFEELMGKDVAEDPVISSAGRIDYSAQASVVDAANAIARWSQRISGYSLLTLVVSIWVMVSSGFTTIMLWWGGISAVLMIAAFFIWRIYIGFGTGAFRYPTRSSRFLPNIVQGFHAGLSGFVGVILFLPILILQVRLLEYGSWSDPILPQFLSWLLSPLAELTSITLNAPITSALVFFALPLGLAIILYRATESYLSVDFTEWRFPEDVAPALYLRSWTTDSITVRMRPIRGRYIDAILPQRSSSFTESIARNLSLVAPVALVGEPGTARQQGVGSMWSSDEHWRNLVKEHAERAVFSVFAASEVPPDSGFSWEIELIGTGNTTGRVAIVFPPNFDFERAFSPGGYLEVAAKLPIFAGLLGSRPTSRTILMARDRAGKWRCHDASIQDDAAYAHCFMDLLMDYVDEWEEGALGDTDFPSTVAFQRFASTLSGGLGMNPLTTSRVIALIYPAIRQLMIVVRRVFFQ